MSARRRWSPATTRGACGGGLARGGSLEAVLARVASVEQELRDVEIRLSDPAARSDPRRLAELGRRHKLLDGIVAAGRRLRAASEDRDEARRMLSEASGGDRAELRAMIADFESASAAAADDLRDALTAPDPNEGRTVIVEIRGAAGGEEANLFARDLFLMYRAFARRRHWTVEILSVSRSGRGGYSEASAAISGAQVWTRLKHEAGTHRVQRVPATESQGRVHTSSVTVTVLPEAQVVDARIDDADLRIDVFRSSGPGGQSVNTTNSAVRVTHLPTGLFVTIQDEKSQHRNKQKALRVLRSKIVHAAQQRVSGERSEKTRTYNPKANRITDHRIGLTMHNLDRVLAGELDEISDALCQNERSAALMATPDTTS